MCDQFWLEMIDDKGGVHHGGHLFCNGGKIWSVERLNLWKQPQGYRCFQFFMVRGGMVDTRGRMDYDVMGDAGEIYLFDGDWMVGLRTFGADLVSNINPNYLGFNLKILMEGKGI